MGLLDDAIREHLELKRRRGADPAEIERAEREALGPVRRSPDALESPEFDEHDVFDRPVAYDHEEHWDEPPSVPPMPAPETSELFEAEPRPFEAEPHEFEREPHELEREPPPFEEEPHDLEDEPHQFEREPPPFEDEPHEPLAAEPHPDPKPQHGEPEPHDPESEHLPPEDEETIEYDVEEELDPHGDDVLEETPEFLQDTPDHDRLWFEQKPPRDFDIGGGS